MRWQNSFGHSYPEAVEHMKDQKSNFIRHRMSNDHWDLVRSQKEAEGFTRKAYEHWIQKGSQSAVSCGEGKPRNSYMPPGESSYLVLLGGVLDTPEKIQGVANLPKPPQAIQAASEDGDALFCRVNGHVKQCIKTWLSHQKTTFKPTFIRLSKAKKDLAVDSIYPTLGSESTLPQHRQQSSSLTSFDVTLPQQRDSVPNAPFPPVRQDEYPVWYFFYGTLADSDLLARLLSLPEAEPPDLVSASISEGMIKSWNGKYNALVDGTDNDYVHGSAYEVASKENEEALMLYETEKYEVVRCCITMASHMVQGLTFRFAGSL